MRGLSLWVVGAAFALAATATPTASLSTAQAATPKDTLVIAKQIDDIITLDPAEVFEFSGGEVIANVYDRIFTFEAEDTEKLVPGVAESYSVSDDGKTITLKIRNVTVRAAMQAIVGTRPDWFWHQPDLGKESYELWDRKSFSDSSARKASSER